MAFDIDPQIVAALVKLLGDPTKLPPPPPAGDWKTRRERTNALMGILGSIQPKATDVTTRDYATKAKDGHSIALRWYEKEGAKAGPGVLYIHGGGMILGSMDFYDAAVMRYVSASGVPMLSVDYRLAPEFPHPTPVEDSYAGLVWLAEHAAELGVDPKRIAVMGDSAGGGLAAGVALAARDRGGPALARQILIYPMLDDRTTTPDPQIAPFATWSYDDNITGWGALLGDARGKADVSPYAAPARASDLSRLPPTFIDVGELDVFRDEDIEYARRLTAAGVSTEFHLYPGAPHGYEAFAPESDVARRVIADRIRYLSRL